MIFQVISIGFKSGEEAGLGSWTKSASKGADAE